MKMSFWNRVILVIRLMFFMSVSKTLRLLFAQDVQPLNDENRENRAELRRNKETMEKQSLRLHEYMSQTVEQDSRIVILEGQLQATDAESKERITSIAKDLSEASSMAATLEVKSASLESQLAETRELIVDKDQKNRSHLADIHKKHTEELDAHVQAGRLLLKSEKQNTEAILQDVLYELRGKGGDDNRYEDSKAGEYCKNLTVHSCRSLRQIKKIQTRIEECEQRIQAHFANRDQADLANE